MSNAYINLPNSSAENPIRKKPNPKKKKGLTPVQTVKYVLSVIGATLLTLFLIVVITVCIVAVALAVYVTQFAENMYDVELKDDVELSYSSFVFCKDRATGEDVQTYQIKADENRVWVDISEIPAHAVLAVISTEDKRFYEHSGVDWGRTVMASYQTFFNDSTQGGSTITQQLVRDITKDDDVNIGRKLREIFSALKMEDNYSKSDILESYLNRIAFGNTTYGIGSAARHYFDKDVSELTLAESCILAGLIRSPVTMNPYANPEKSRERQIYSLNECMYAQGLITYSQYQAAYNEKVKFRLPVRGEYFGYADERYNEYYGIQSDVSSEDEDLYYEDVSWDELLGDPYRWNEYEVEVDWYTDAALKEVVKDLAALKGVTEETARALLKRGGYRIYLNKDIEMQEKIEELFKNPYLVRNPSYPYPAGVEAKDTLQAAFVILDYTGNVVALAGGLGDKPGNDAFNRATQSKRNIGSTVKPIAVYAPAVDMNKITYSTKLLDKAGEIDDEKKIGEKVVWPRNYEGDYGSGSYMSAWQAVMHSTNTISARTLYLVGLQNSFTFMQEKLGFTTLERSIHLAYSPIATGSIEIKLHELAAAYQIFGNGGAYFKPSFYSRVEDNNGKVILEQDTTGVQAIEKDSAWIVNRMMKKVVEFSGGSAQYSNMIADYGIEVVGKTGTANDMANLLYAGLTPDYVGIIRIGYDDNHEIQPIGIDRWRRLAEIWKDVMKECIPTDEPRTFTPEPTVATMNYCSYTGMIATPSCPSSEVGYYRKSNVPGLCTASKHGEGSTFFSDNPPMEITPYYKGG